MTIDKAGLKMGAPQALNDLVDKIETAYGDTSDLETSATDAVAAINEINTKVGSTTVSGVTASDSVNGILTELASRIAALEAV